MEENHLKPEDQNYENTTQDLINASLIFGRALGLILKEKQGIVIDVKGEIKFPEEVGVSVNLETDSPE